jgi:hypothetical protein
MNVVVHFQAEVNLKKEMKGLASFNNHDSEEGMYHALWKGRVRTQDLGIPSGAL